MGPSDHDGRRPWDLLITWEATVGPSDHESHTHMGGHTWDLLITSHTLTWEVTVGPSDHESHTHMGGDRGTF